MTFWKPTQHSPGGYGGVELLLTVAIAGILFGLLMVQVTNYRARHRDDERRKDIAVLQKAVAGIYAVKGVYPVNLAKIKALPAEACRAPGGSGSCQNPDYVYKSFRRGTTVAPDTKADCNNKKIVSTCVGFIIYTDAMEKANNPYAVRSY